MSIDDGKTRAPAEASAPDKICASSLCPSPAWWLWRGVHTRSHLELGRKSPQRQWYFVLRRGRVGRCQACERQRQSLHHDISSKTRRSRHGRRVLHLSVGSGVFGLRSGRIAGAGIQISACQCGEPANIHRSAGCEVACHGADGLRRRQRRTRRQAQMQKRIAAASAIHGATNARIETPTAPANSPVAITGFPNPAVSTLE